jgi:16S rRNA (adenine1518-N6/adenine1519-N6)-dimethyltransferase
MVQREVGLRLVARAGDDDYGGVSVKIAYLAEAKLVSKISRRVFLPEPAVESVLVELTRRPEPPVDVERDRLFGLVDAAFGHRRKTIRNALREAGADAAAIDGAARASGVDANARAEQLPLEQLAALAQDVDLTGARRR